MNIPLRLRAIALALLVLAWGGDAYAQFFVGVPTITASTSSGTLGNTLVATPNNFTQEIDVTGQLTVTNATPFTQLLQFDVSIGLDPTFNGGAPLLQQLSVTQSGYVDVPPAAAGGMINGWTIQALMLDSTSNPIPGANVFDNHPAFPLGYGPGLGQTYGPQTATGAPFNYQPAPSQTLLLHFQSTFEGSTVPNTYVWDFPITVQSIPEPTGLSLLAAGAAALARRWRRAVD